jgi:nitrate reductase NapE component
MEKLKAMKDRPTTVGGLVIASLVITAFQFLGGWAWIVWMLDARIQQNLQVHQIQSQQQMMETYVSRQEFSAQMSLNNSSYLAILESLKANGEKMDQIQQRQIDVLQRLSRIEGKITR